MLNSKYVYVKKSMSFHSSSPWIYQVLLLAMNDQHCVGTGDGHKRGVGENAAPSRW